MSRKSSFPSAKRAATRWNIPNIVLEDVLVTQTDFNGVGQNDAILVDYAFQASKVTMSYWEQGSSGTKGAESKSGWDIKQNKES